MEHGDYGVRNDIAHGQILAALFQFINDNGTM
jgi:hypothetical protein